MGGRIIVQQEKISTAERRWTNRSNALQKTIHLLLCKILHLLFFLLYEFVLHYDLRAEKNYQHILDAEFEFLRASGCLTNTFRIQSLCYVVTG